MFKIQENNFPGPINGRELRPKNLIVNELDNLDKYEKDTHNNKIYEE